MKALLGVLVAAVIAIGAPGALLGVGVLAAVSGGTSCVVPAPTAIGEADPTASPAPPAAVRVVMPLPTGTYSVSDSYGWRDDPFTGERAFHGGTDFPAADGTPILAVADGTVRLAGYIGGWGNLVVLHHQIDGQTVASVYAHMWDTGIHVTEGQSVRAGDWIGDVGSSGRSTGPHLHLEIRPGGWGQPTIDPLTWLADHDAEGIDEAGITRPGCLAGA